MAMLMAGIESLSSRHNKRVRLLLGVPHATECPIYVFWRYAVPVLPVISSLSLIETQKILLNV